ncbi:MAG: Crp/Fnr family transcriptional regulator [Lachnospiraceae bacterium]|jgi:CRP-like cAMP-binding protein|nr:Crp/Fnr family transcriptional regulator [Lachnospiraceae bacterium]
MTETKYQAEEVLCRLSFWEKPDRGQKAYIRNDLSVRHYEKGSMIYGCSEVCPGMVCVLKGCIRVYLLSEEGRRRRSAAEQEWKGRQENTGRCAKSNKKTDKSANFQNIYNVKPGDIMYNEGRILRGYPGTQESGR